MDATGRKVSGELHMLIHRDLSLNLPVNAFFTDSKGVQRKGNNLQALQSELIEDLLPIAQRPEGFNRAKLQAHLLALIDKISA